MGMFTNWLKIKKTSKNKYDNCDIEYLPESNRYYPRYKKQYLYYWSTSHHYTLQFDNSDAIYFKNEEDAKKAIDICLEQQGIASIILKIKNE